MRQPLGYIACQLLLTVIMILSLFAIVVLMFCM